MYYVFFTMLQIILESSILKWHIVFVSVRNLTVACLVKFFTWSFLSDFEVISKGLTE